MNILLINHYAGSPHHGMEYRPYYFAREWVRLGHQVTIVAASYSHLRSRNPPCGGLSTVELIDGIRYIWLRTPAYSGNGMRRILNMLLFLAQLLMHWSVVVRAARGGAVVASSTYPLDVVVGSRIAGGAGAKLIYEVHDLWPLSPIELGRMSPRHPFIRVMQWAEEFAYRNVDCVISMLPLAESHMRKHGLAQGKFHYIPNGIDPAQWTRTESFLPEIHQTVLSTCRAQKRFLIGYAGAFGLANDLATVVHAAKLLAESPVTFIFVGQGPEKNNLQALARRLNISNVTFLPAVSRADVPSVLSAMDALIITLRRTSLFRFGISPNKLLDYMMAGRPVIHAIDAGNDLVAESGCGLSIPPGDPAAIAAAALELMHMSQAGRDAMGRAGRRYVEANHEYGDLARRCLSAL